MNRIPTVEEYLVLFEEWSPKPGDDLTQDEKLLAMLHYIGAANANLATYVSLYEEYSGKDISALVISQFVTNLENLGEDKGAE